MFPEIALALVLAVASPAPTAPTSPGDSWIMYLIGSGGAVVIAGALFKTIQDLVKGRAQQKEARTADAILQRDTAWRERDEERRLRRRAERVAACEAGNTRRMWDHASRLKRELIARGVPEAEIPAEPELKDCELIPVEDDPDETPGHSYRR